MTGRVKVSRASFECDVLADPHPDTSYAEQVGFEADLAGIQAGTTTFHGIRASVTLDLPTRQGTIVQRIESPGVWGVGLTGSTGDRAFVESIYIEECDILAQMLEALGVTVTK